MTPNSSILYKFRSNQEFRALPLIATASGARLGFIKQLILQTNKLDQGRGAYTRTTEVDLIVRNQNDGVVLDDDDLWIPRGARLVVERTYAARGHGLPSRLKQTDNNYRRYPRNKIPSTSNAATGGTYTIDCRASDQDEFVSVSSVIPSFVANNASSSLKRKHPSPITTINSVSDDSDTVNSRNTEDDGTRRAKNKRYRGMPKTVRFAMMHTNSQKARLPVEQPYSINSSTTKTLSIPDYLQCPLCHNLMENAVLLPWGGGHSTCESCIRIGLVTAGQLFVCPLTGRQGVTPDEVLPNPALRMAVSHFKARSSQSNSST